ncbi:glycoside hydrolase family 3 protein [Algoriphagus sediminis]|uniref:beta-N-acetylhexosaminidase n=1 Tax=Algoriphagus sediminis TaxID=3057113 RepID=A0ABT7YHB4_9BACT|nr:glycoside hydrolase family 3 N-terminal domain-containing protein [Algoriphagus sediminis]MDN3205896.1 glycoside hydrolase family 3 N-terminal domain-containing protein [Algoriphagus sediminis]
MNLNKKQIVAQCFSPAAFIHDTEENYQEIERLITEEEIGGLTFFHSRHSAAANFEKRAESLETSGTLEKLIELINRYQSISKIPLLISIDGEYGLAMRVESTPQYPFAITLGALKENEEELVEEVGYRMGMEMEECGIHLNLAPCADVNTNPNNPVIGYRSFGDDVKRVSKLSFAMYTGLTKAGIGACLKHFPGHGDTATDSHLGLPILDKSMEELEAEELVPFQYGIDRGVEMIMVGHLAVPALTNGKNIPASISHEIITGLLKGKMGFDGIVISDALNMKAVANMFDVPGELELKAFQAGNDILCFSDHVREGIEMIEGKASDEEIENAFVKVWELKEKLGVMNERTVLVPEFDWKSHSEFQKELAKDYVSVISGKLDKSNLKKLSDSDKLGYKEFFGTENSNFKKSLDFKFVDSDQAEALLISVFVPSHKPLNQFGIDAEKLKEIKALAKERRCYLLHFGNPLALKYFGTLEDYEAVICGYQNFEEVKQRVIQILT